MTYKIHLINFGTIVDASFTTLDAAVAKAKQICFEAAIYCDGNLSGTWTPFAGYCPYR